MKAIFWDFDATLGYNDGRWTGTLTEIVNKRYPDMGIVCDDIRPYMSDGGFPWHNPDVEHPGQTADEWWEALFPMLVRGYRNAGVEEERAFELAGLVRKAYLDPSTWHLFDDTRLALEELSDSGWTHFILSNHVPELPDIVGSLGIANMFAGISTSACSGYEKPNPKAFRLLMDKLPHGSTVWMIGDNFEADVKGAEAVGIPAILVRGRNDDAKFSCESLSEASEMLNRLERNRKTEHA